MLRYALLACLHLFVGAYGQLTDDDRSVYHEPPGLQLKNYLISPDIFEGRETFLVAQYEETPDLSLLVKVTLFKDALNAEPKQCSWTMKIKPHTYEWNVTSLRRVSETKFVFSWYQRESNEVFRTSQVFAYDMKNCRVTDLDLNSVTKNPIVVPTTDENFLVFVNDRNFCRMLYTKCFWSYDMSRDKRSELRWFSVDIDWSTLKIERLNSEKYVASGSSMEGDRYIVLLMYLSNSRDFEIISRMQIPYNNLKVEIVSSGMSFCWIENPENNMTVRCRQMNDNGDEILAETINFDVPRTLIDVHATREGELLLITKNAACSDERDCWNMWATRVRPFMTKPVERISLPFSACTAHDQHELTVFDAHDDAENMKTDLYFACKSGEKFYFKTYNIYFE